MTSLRQDVQNVVERLDLLRARILDELGPEVGSASVAAIDACCNALRHNIDVPPTKRKRRRTQKQLLTAMRVMRLRTKVAKKRLIAEAAAKVSGRIQSIWFLRAGLASPTLPMRTLSEFCKDFPREETCNISHVYVGAARDAFCQIIKEFNRNEVVAMLSKAQSSITDHGVAIPVFVGHVQDEALMQMRGYDAEAHAAQGGTADKVVLSRAKHSKIQNHFVRVHTANDTVEWYTELQALFKKDGETIGWALATTLMEIVRLVEAAAKSAARAYRVVHLVSGDGVHTNENAMKRLFLPPHTMYHADKM